MGDTGNALLSAIGITSALYRRELTGVGQEVGTSIVNAGLLHTSYAWIDADGKAGDFGQVDAGQYGLSPLHRLYPCAEETWLFVAARSPEHARGLCGAIGETDALLDDPAKLGAALETQLATLPAVHWQAVLDVAGVPVEIVDEAYCRRLFDDPDARADELISETWAGSVGRFEDPGLLVTFSDTQGVIQRGPAMCGEHTRELLVECGYDDDEIAAMIEDRAVLDAPVTQP